MLKKQIFTETWKEKKEEYLCKSEIINHSFDQNEENGDIENKERDNFLKQKFLNYRLFEKLFTSFSNKKMFDLISILLERLELLVSVCNN